MAYLIPWIHNCALPAAPALQSQSVEQHRDVLERPVATSALAAVIHFAELMVDAGAGGKLYGLSLYDPGRYMRVDAAAQVCAALWCSSVRNHAGGRPHELLLRLLDSTKWSLRITTTCLWCSRCAG